MIGATCIPGTIQFELSSSAKAALSGQPEHDIICIIDEGGNLLIGGKSDKDAQVSGWIFLSPPRGLNSFSPQGEQRQIFKTILTEGFVGYSILRTEDDNGNWDRKRQHFLTRFSGVYLVHTNMPMTHADRTVLRFEGGGREGYNSPLTRAPSPPSRFHCVSQALTEADTAKIQTNLRYEAPSGDFVQASANFTLKMRHMQLRHALIEKFIYIMPVFEPNMSVANILIGHWMSALDRHGIKAIDVRNIERIYILIRTMTIDWAAQVGGRGGIVLLLTAPTPSVFGTCPGGPATTSPLNPGTC